MKALHLLMIFPLAIAGAALAADNAPPPSDCDRGVAQCYALFSSSPAWVGLRQVTEAMDLDKCRARETTNGTFRMVDQNKKVRTFPRVAMCSPVGHDWKDNDAKPSVDLTPPDLKKFERNDTYDPVFVSPRTETETGAPIT